jgi:hypothetical protein
MKTNKVPRERNPFLLSGKRRWRLFRWIWGRHGASNNLLSQTVKPAELFVLVIRKDESIL